MAIKIQKLALLLVCTICTPEMLQAQDRYDGPIIDMHLHADDSIWSERQICFPQPCESAATIATTPEEVRDGTVAVMRELNIVLGYLSGDADTLRDWAESAPGLFILSPWVFDPVAIDIEAMRTKYEQGFYRGMGEIAVQYEGFVPADKEVIPLFALAAEFNVPVQLHLNGNGAPRPTFRVSNGDPRLLEEVIAQFPDLRIVVENCGHPFADEMTAMMYQYPQLYCEVSTILHLMPRKAALRHLEVLVERGLGKRIMYGSDQMIWPEVIPVVIEAIQSAEFLSAEQKADIFYNNAARFLRLSQQEIAMHHGR